MFNKSDKPRVFTSKEKPLREVLVQYDVAEHYDRFLMDNLGYHAEERKYLAHRPACTKQIIVICETDEEAIRTAKYHFSDNGSNFKVIKTI